jgi:hypothetical protein
MPEYPSVDFYHNSYGTMSRDGADLKRQRAKRRAARSRTMVYILSTELSLSTSDESIIDA